MDDRNQKSGWAARLLVLLVLLVASPIAQAACDDEARAIKDVVDDWDGDMSQLEAQQEKAMALMQKDGQCALAVTQLSRIVRKAGFLKGNEYRPENLAKSKELALQAVQMDGDCYLCLWDLAHVYFFYTDTPAFNNTLNRLRKAEKTPLDHVYTQVLEANFVCSIGKDCAKAAQMIEAVQGDDELYIKLYRLDVQKQAYRQTGKLQQADAAYREQLKLKPTAWAYGDYAAFLTGYLKQHDQAVAYARKSLSLKDYPLGHVKLSTALANKAFDMIKAGDLRGSIPLNEEALKENRYNTHASNNLGYAYRELALNHSSSWEQHQENKNKAVEWYNATLRVDANNDYAKRELKGIGLWKVR
jgi:hypothetical protein